MTDESNLTNGEQATTETPAVSGQEEQQVNQDASTSTEQPKGGEEQGKPNGEGEEAQGAPEKYEWNQGEGVEIDEKLAGEFEPLAREMNLTNDQANKLASEMLPKVQQHMSETWQKQVDDWRQAAETDAEFGGAKFEQTMTDARKVLEAYGSPELTEVLDQTGLGNHPALVKMFAQMGASLKEDQIVKGQQPQAEKSTAEVLYGTK